MEIFGFFQGLKMETLLSFLNNGWCVVVHIYVRNLSKNRFASFPFVLCISGNVDLLLDFYAYRKWLKPEEVGSSNGAKLHSAFQSHEGQNSWNHICLYWFCIYYYDVIIKPKAIIMRLCLLFLFQLNTLYSLESRNDQGKIIDILMESKGYQKLNLHLGAKILLLFKS